MTIYCIGRNYVKHAQELGNDIPTSPLVFLKSENALRGLEASPLAFATETFHHEIEMVLKIGRDFSLGDKSSFDDIESIGLGIDLTRREEQNQLKKQGLPWTTAKSFMGSAILGELRPFQARNYTFELKVNGETRQKGDTQFMIFPFKEICDYLNSFSPLKRGDLIYTGTPEGVAGIKAGDKFELILDGELVEVGEL